MPICGPKLSICCSVVSIWGIIMLTDLYDDFNFIIRDLEQELDLRIRDLAVAPMSLMGVFYRIHSPALFEDIPFDEKEWAKKNFTISYIHEKYDQTALNCFIAAGLYVVFFIFSFIQHRLNSRANYEMR